MPLFDDLTKRVFVTVGTTSFDDLISHVLQPDTLDVLEDCGYSHLTLQVGRGAEPVITHDRRIGIEWYRLKDSILPDIESASLVISHAGAGSCLEVLRAGKPLVVVVNHVLMGNHQTELANKLQAEQHALTYCPAPADDRHASFRSAALSPVPVDRDDLVPESLKALLAFLILSSTV
uniref:UDP-N-acetylglucosamine transferase subunit ALG13 n=1 Tax=Alona affinis TaxID=381656 RepID=A0A9N6WPM3_9CRUS|nr:EOG090X0KOU [Alona affinis]